MSKIEKSKPVDSKQSVVIYFKLRGSDTKIDVEPGEEDIVVWGYGSTKQKILN